LPQNLTNNEKTWAVEILLEATQQRSTTESIKWLAEDHPVVSGCSWINLLRALVLIGDESAAGRRALRRATKEATSSDFDTSRMIFNPSSIRRPSDFKLALDALQHNSSGDSLSALDAPGLLRAQQESNLAIEALCLIAGVSYSDACDWFNPSSAEWNRDSAGRLVAYLDDLVNGRCESFVPASAPSRAIEFFESDGWSRADEFLRDGVPYEVLLAQRAGGGVWLAHKNKTSSRLNISIANLTCSMLDEEQIEFLRATQLGGDVRQSDLQELTGIRDKRVGLVVLKAGRPAVLVCFSSAKDSGTARANGDGLLQIPVGDKPFAAVLTGLGWSARTETDRLAQHFGGLLFTEKTLRDLVTFIRGVID
jgi:hypothetical protein